MSIPKVSIIVPTYNVEKYAPKCFDSLIGQTLQNIEIILVDDGSTDSSGNICDQYALKDDRIKVIHQKNIGLGLTRNSGMSVARGEYIGFVDSDDYVSEDMYRVLYENAQKYNADISYCQCKEFNVDSDISNETKKNQSNIKVWREEEIQKYLLARIGLPPEEKEDHLYSASVCCGIFSRERLEQINATFVSEREYISEDIIFDIDVIPKCETIVHSDDKLYYYRCNSSSLTRIYRDGLFEKDIKLYNEMRRHLDNVMTFDQYKNSIYRYLIMLARIAIMQEVQFYRKNSYKTAIENIKKICNNTQLIDVLNDYDFLKLPVKYSTFCMMEKHKLSKLCFVECYLYERFIKHLKV